jgi:hypothetical protein
MRCPIHQGDGLNFQILDSGRSWKCFSHNCGAGHRRDGVTLYCLLRHGRAFRDLDSTTKGLAIRAMADLAGVDLDEPEVNRPKSEFDRRMPQLDQSKLKKLFENTSLLDGPHGHAAEYESRMAQRMLLFLAVAKGMEKLPKKITEQWLDENDFWGFLDGKYSG